jgi:hypothetical protein
MLVRLDHRKIHRPKHGVVRPIEESKLNRLCMPDDDLLLPSMRMIAMGTLIRDQK